MALASSALGWADFPTRVELGEGFFHSSTLHSLQVALCFAYLKKQVKEKTHRENEKNIEGRWKLNVLIRHCRNT